MFIKDLQRVAHKTAVDHGWWDDNVRNKGELIALMHSELSEALEALRKPGPSEHIPEYSNIEEEFADTIIRILDFCGYCDYDLEGAILAKMEFNKSRPHKHGGKKF